MESVHSDQQCRQYIVTGIREGFRVGFDYRRPLKSVDRNMASVSHFPQAIRDNPAEECAKGRILGPFPMGTMHGAHISRFGLTPKKSPGEWRRLIVDLSSPEGFSVNDGVSSHLCSVNYVSIDDALREVSRLGAGSLLAKVDIQKAYRNIPVHPRDRLLLGMTWEGGLFIDATLPFGLRSAPKIFSAVADAAEWMVRAEGVTSIMHYLDDFLLVGPPGSDVCQKSMDLPSKCF